jgi:Asp-tRNA(Asn)/Glu-tRNA(Gln) amidotransferase C subunit
MTYAEIMAKLKRLRNEEISAEEKEQIIKDIEDFLSFIFDN